MALGTQPHGKLLDFEQYIDHQLGRTRARIKMTDILTASLVLVAAALGILFLEVVLDHLFGLPLWLRRIVLLLGVSGGAAYFVLRIVSPMARRVNGLYAARTIEQTDPSFKNSLINYLDLRKHRGEHSKTVMAAIEAKAVRDLTQVEIDSVVNQRRLMQVAYGLSAIVVVFCLYAAMTPKSILDSAKRAFIFDVVRPTNTRLVNIKPGDDPKLARVVAGDIVPYSVEVQGTRPEKVVLHWSVDGSKFFAAQELAPGKNYYDPWQFTMRNVQQSVDYYFTGGDAESLRYHLEVLPAPMVTAVTLDYEFPKYTGVPPRANIEGGNVEAIEGTIVTVHAQTNDDARSAYLDFSKAENKHEPMEVSTANARELTGRFRVEDPGSYTIKFTTTGGQPNPEPVVYDILVHRDNPPTAHFIRPDQPEIKLPSNVAVTLMMEAKDDFGVKDATLHVLQENESLVSENLLEQRAPVKEFKGSKVLDLASLKLKPGSKLSYWLTVRDTKEPVSNRAETTHQTILIDNPLPPKELKKFEETARKEKDEEQPPPADPAETGGNDEPVPPSQPGKEQAGVDQNPPKDDTQPGKEPKDQQRPAPDLTEQEKENNDQAQPPPLTPDEQRRLKDLERALGMNNQAPQPPPPGGNPPPSPNNGQNAGDPTQANPAPPQNPNANPQSPPASRANGTNPPQPNGPSGRNPNSTPPANQQWNPAGSSEVQRADRTSNPPPAAGPQNPSRNPRASEPQSKSNAGPSNSGPKTNPENNASSPPKPGPQPGPNQNAKPTAPAQAGANNPPSSNPATPNTETPPQPNPNAPPAGFPRSSVRPAEPEHAAGRSGRSEQRDEPEHEQGSEFERTEVGPAERERNGENPGQE